MKYVRRAAMLNDTIEVINQKVLIISVNSYLCQRMIDSSVLLVTDLLSF